MSILDDIYLSDRFIFKVGYFNSGHIWYHALFVWDRHLKLYVGFDGVTRLTNILEYLPKDAIQVHDVGQVYVNFAWLDKLNESSNWYSRLIMDWWLI